MSNQLVTIPVPGAGALPQSTGAAECRRCQGPRSFYVSPSRCSGLPGAPVGGGPAQGPSRPPPASSREVPKPKATCLGEAEAKSHRLASVPILPGTPPFRNSGSYLFHRGLRT